MISVSYVLVTFTDVSIKAFDLPKLRGFFSRQYPEEHLFHNHLPGASQSYRFPRIQYRVINGHPALFIFKQSDSRFPIIICDNPNIIIYSRLTMVIFIIVKHKGVHT
jgi:hypothetical protein